MSWVIARHVYKSGNRNIHSLVGRFNFASSKKCQRLKTLANGVKNSKIWKGARFPRKRWLGMPLKHIELYKCLDRYVMHKTLYIDRQDSGGLACFGRAEHWESQQIFYRHFSSQYAKELMNKIYTNCISASDVFHKYKCDIPVNNYTEASKVFNDISIYIISKNKKYSSLLEYLKLHATPRDNLLKKTVRYCMNRWEGKV